MLITAMSINEGFSNRLCVRLVIMLLYNNNLKQVTSCDHLAD